jgi:D-alanyl-lipoteichoic acid acyltransferase DltB (MBOAT superfamily)
MAVGLAALFGIVLPLNFNVPYLANTLQDFWRRWHITLSVWFRDYLYIPLGGNRRNRDINLLITMTLAGLWHGAGWNFLLWGFGHGLWLIIERHTPSLPKSWDNRFLRSLRTFLVFHGICLLWVLFRSPEISQALLYFHRLLLPPLTSSKVPGVLVIWLIACLLLQAPLTQSFRQVRFTQLSLPVQWILATLAGYLILVYAEARMDFIYFTF